MKTVELIPASMFVCDECGRDNFVRQIVLDPEMRTDEMIETEKCCLDELKDRLGDAVPTGGTWSMNPSEVKCGFCGTEYTAVEFREDD